MIFLREPAVRSRAVLHAPLHAISSCLLVSPFKALIGHYPRSLMVRRKHVIFERHVATHERGRERARLPTNLRNIERVTTSLDLVSTALLPALARVHVVR